MIASEIIQAAYREENRIPVGRQPTAAEQAEGLRLLNGCVEVLFGNDVATNLLSWDVPPLTDPNTRYAWPLAWVDRDGGQELHAHPPANASLKLHLSGPVSVWLQAQPVDGSRVDLIRVTGVGVPTIYGNGRLVDGQESIQPALATPMRLFYRDDLATWKIIQPMALTSESPLPPDLDEYLVLALAVRLAASFGQAPMPTTLVNFEQFRKKLRTRYQTASLQAVEVDPFTTRSPFMPGSAYDGSRWPFY